MVIWGCPESWVIPQARWMVDFMLKPIKIDDSGVPLFQETSHLHTFADIEWRDVFWGYSPYS